MKFPVLLYKEPRLKKSQNVKVTITVLLIADGIVATPYVQFD